MSLHALTLDAFRGATKEVGVIFDPKKKITLIFGENGTGKSTIVDALTFVCDKALGSLEDRSGAQDEKYLVSVGRRKKELRVDLTCATGAWQASYSGKNVLVSPATGCPELRVLRRARLMKLVDAEPKKKYDEIRNFIETPGIERSEQTLRDATSSVSSELDTLSRDYTNAETQLTELWNKDGSGTARDAITWARGINGQNITALESEKWLIKEFEKFKDTFQLSTGRLRQDIEAEATTQSAYDAAATQQTLEETKQAGQSTSLLSLLRSAQSYVGEHLQASNCPLCDNPADGVSLNAKITERIAALTELSAAVDVAQTKRTALQHAQKETQKVLHELSLHAKSIVEFLLAGKFPLQFAVTINDEFIVNLSDKNKLPKDRLQAAVDILAILNAHFAGMNVHLAEIQKVISLKNAVLIQLTNIDNNSDKRRELQSLQQRLSAVLKIVEEERKGFVGELLVEISESVSALYEKIHPGESLSKIKLLLDPKYKGSLHIKGVFGVETDIPPQAYFSESHLDTLGICIWLALTKKYAKKDTIVILDDVLTSVDGSHLDRFIDMLDGETSHFAHVLLTTHYRPWRERYRMHQTQGAKIHFIELKEWHSDWGIITDSYKPAIQELQDWLQPQKFDRQIVASKAGIFLESVLDDFALRYSIQVPRKASQDYMLGELLDGLSRKKRKHLKIERLDSAGNITETIQLEPILDAIDTFAWVRNKVGCHFSVLGQDASDKDVREFAGKVVELGIAVTCPSGGEIPRHNKSGSYYESKSGQCRLYPLEMP